MGKTAKKRWTKKKLLALGISAVLIPGILLAISLGWKPRLSGKVIFPSSGVVASIKDGDTFSLKNGRDIRLLGIDAPDRGKTGYEDAKNALLSSLKGKKVFLEYDRYQDDKYGRVLAWVWVDCETTPTFLPADYMHLTGNASRKGLTENPKGCKKGTLVNEKMVEGGFAKIVTYKDRGELKYEKRLMLQ